MEMTFGERCKAVRNKLYLSQTMLANELGVAFATVNRWEKGRREPNLQHLRAFASFCKKNGIEEDLTR